MKKTAFLCVFLIVLAAIKTDTPVLAFERISAVRIKLSKYSAANSLVFADKSLSAGFEANGYFSNMLTLTALYSFSAQYSTAYFAAQSSVYHDAASAYAQVSAHKSAGLKAVICLKEPGQYAVYAGPYNTLAEAQNAALLLGQAQVRISDRLIVLFDGNEPAAVFDSISAFPQFFNPDGFTSLADRRYRGRIECARYSKSGLDIINVLPLEEYLYSVVPSEMPASWNIEAIKAQCIAARTYVYKRSGIHSDTGAELCDTTHCQVYLGQTNEHQNVIQAVNLTAGMLALYDGQPIEAVYFSSSGGYTENSEDVWTQSVPYLRAVPDVYETTGKTWSRSFTLSDLNAALTAKGINIGQATGISITEVSASGRVQKLVINGTNASYILTKEEIRTFFSSMTGGSLESKNFTITNGAYSGSSRQVYIYTGASVVLSALTGLSAQSALGAGIISASESPIYVLSAGGLSTVSTAAGTASSLGNVIQLEGKGYGHGAGMSQHGANGMANAGFNFEQILKYYYSGIEVR